MMLIAFFFFTAPLWLMVVAWPVLKLLDLKGWHRLWWVPFCWLIIFGWVMDVITAHSWWAVLFGWPKHNEVTVSDTLERLVIRDNERRWHLAYGIALDIERISPGHIKALIQCPHHR